MTTKKVPVVNPSFREVYLPSYWRLQRRVMVQVRQVRGERDETGCLCKRMKMIEFVWRKESWKEEWRRVSERLLSSQWHSKGVCKNETDLRVKDSGQRARLILNYTDCIKQLWSQIFVFFSETWKLCGRAGRRSRGREVGGQQPSGIGAGNAARRSDAPVLGAGTGLTLGDLTEASEFSPSFWERVHLSFLKQS